MTLRRIHSLYTNQLFKPIQAAAALGPKCLMCGKVVNFEQIVEEATTYTKVLIRCHGQEELRTYNYEREYPDFEDPLRNRDLTRMRHADTVFDPMADLEPAPVVVTAAEAAVASNVGQ